jgi:large subunit ribosomal protein L18Ae
MRIFAEDEVHAKSRFWYFLKRSNKVKKASGEILSVSEVFLINNIDFRKRPIQG